MLAGRGGLEPARSTHRPPGPRRRVGWRNRRARTCLRLYGGARHVPSSAQVVGATVSSGRLRRVLEGCVVRSSSEDDYPGVLDALAQWWDLGGTPDAMGRSWRRS